MRSEPGQENIMAQFLRGMMMSQGSSAVSTQLRLYTPLATLTWLCFVFASHSLAHGPARFVSPGTAEQIIGKESSSCAKSVRAFGKIVALHHAAQAQKHRVHRHNKDTRLQAQLRESFGLQVTRRLLLTARLSKTACDSMLNQLQETEIWK